MTEEECVAEVAKQSKISKSAARKAIKAFAELFFGVLETGVKIDFPGGSIGGCAKKELEHVSTPDLPYT